ncbi:ABC transporter permease [Brevundimonas sp. FT23042]|uniref:ABC transporter permease n=1 Tax=Brevundimonas sp. FT23042 TaxID=3393749 RepID=UPI003B589867
MKRSALTASFVKELRLLSRDIHGLALLFLLPLTFILIMSLALQDMFETRGGAGVAVLVVNRDGQTQSQAFIDRLRTNDAFVLRTVAVAPGPAAARELLGREDAAFLLDVGADYETRIAALTSDDPGPLVTVTAAADTNRQIEKIFVAAVNEAVGRQRSERILERVGYPVPEGERAGSGGRVVVNYAYADDGAGKAPSSVQQSVPAWLVFALFFVAVPFSNSFIRERQVGAQRRLRSTNIGPLAQIFGKLIPYFGINQLQVVLMLAAGVWLVPALGGDALRINGSIPALVALSAVLSMAALGMALLIAVSARTTEQATLLAGLGSIVLAAIGGVMVPKFVMPEVMQRIAELSPMSWGVDGFLTLLLDGGGVVDILPELFKLTAFGAVALMLALFRYRLRE